MMDMKGYKVIYGDVDYNHVFEVDMLSDHGVQTLKVVVLDRDNTLLTIVDDDKKFRFFPKQR